MVWTSSPAPKPESNPVLPERQPGDWLWLSCGGGKHKCGLDFDIQAQAKDRHELRCCSKTHNERWNSVGGDCRFWAESDLLKDPADDTEKCFHKVTYAEGKAICEYNNAYVCTREDIESGCTQRKC